MSGNTSDPQLRYLLPPTLPSGLRLPHHIFRESFLTSLSLLLRSAPVPTGLSCSLGSDRVPATAEASAFVPGSWSCETGVGRTTFSAGRVWALPLPWLLAWLATLGAPWLREASLPSLYPASQSVLPASRSIFPPCKSASVSLPSYEETSLPGLGFW